MNCKSLINLKGPAIIASNHPDSMFDAALIGIYCGQPVHFIIRSDMFNKPLFRWLLKRLNGIPVYRQSEEKGKLRQNTSTMERCKQVLQQKGIILIFSEGSTEHDWKLKPLKSGTARIVQYCLTDEGLKESLRVLPLGITHNNFDRFGKVIILHSVDSFYPGKLDYLVTDGEWKKNFNQPLAEKMLPLAPQLHRHDPAHIYLWKIILTNLHQVHASRQSFPFEELLRVGQKVDQLSFEPPFFEKESKYPYYPLYSNQRKKNIFFSIILFPPALAGLVWNGPFYFTIRSFCRAKTRDTIFYDSLFFALLTFLYPVYVLLLSILLYFITPLPFWSWWLIMPATGWIMREWWVNVSAWLNGSASRKEELAVVKELLDIR